MKTTLQSRLLTSLAVALLCTPAMAQSPERDGDQRDARPDPEQRSNREGRPEGRRDQRGGPPFEMMMRIMPVLAALDADKDGTISESEIANASAALKTLDENNDGKLTVNELRPEMAAMRGRGEGGARRGGGGFLTRMFEQRDSNQDGKLTGDEIPPRMSERLQQIDTDGDEAISKEEAAKAMAAIRGDFGGRRGPGPGRPDGDRPRRPGDQN